MEISQATLVDEMEFDKLALMEKAPQYRLYDGLFGVFDKAHETPCVWYDLLGLFAIVGMIEQGLDTFTRRSVGIGLIIVWIGFSAKIQQPPREIKIVR